MEQTSLSLLDRLQQQSIHDDWTRFVHVYKPFIVHFIRFDALLAADAEDVCQEVLAKVAQHLPRFQRQRDGSPVGVRRGTCAALDRPQVAGSDRSRFFPETVKEPAAARILSVA